MGHPIAPRTYSPPPASTLEILLHDASLIVVNKPPGLLSVPGRGRDKEASVLRYLQVEFGDVYDVHRLDMDTSGLIVFARTVEAQRHLAGQFQTRCVVKTYEALVAGRPNSASGRIELPIGRRWEDRPRRCIDVADGKDAITEWTVVTGTAERSHLELVPLTGRTHQLRVHLHAIGHPIIGDRLYGNSVTEERLYLHARGLELTHPDTAQLIEITSLPNFR